MKKIIFSLAVLLFPGFAWADDFTINSAEDWQTVCSNAETYANGTLTLGTDISVTTSFPSAFTGTLDGQGHTITYNLTNPGKFGLFIQTGEGALIKDLKIEGAIVANTGVSGVVYTVSGATTIQNVKVSVDISSNSYPLSGFVVEGKSKVTITGCEYSGTLWCYTSKSADCAGFISRLTDNGAFSISNCCFSGTVREENKDNTAGAWRASGFVSTVENIAEAEDCYFTNCSYTGKILQGNGSVRLGGYVASANASNISYYFKNCLMAGSVEHWKSNSDPTYATDADNIIVSATNKAGKFYSDNCYIVPSLCLIESYSNTPAFTATTTEQQTSGALCFALNGNQEEINFYQTLNTDALPVLDATHGQVFAVGRKHCNGDDYEGVTYNNTGGESTIDDHNFVDGFCDYCGQLHLDDEGYFLVTSQTAWEKAAEQINSGNAGLKIKLETDVEQHSVLKDGYFGTLDGQGHTIDVTMGSTEETDNNVGTGKVSLFGTMGGATIRNIVFTGTLTGTSNTAPIACYSNGEVHIENVISKVTVIQTSTVDGNCSGMIGKPNNGVYFKNCVFAGKIGATKDAGGFMGWSDNQTHHLDNCVMIGDVNINTGSSAVFCRIKNNNTVLMTNCYYAPCSPTLINGTGSSEIALNAKKITLDQLASGALCYMLNGDQSQIEFYQTLGTDAFPVPFAEGGHAQVYASGRKHCNGDDYGDVNYNNESGGITQDEHDFVDGVCNYCGEILTDENGVFHIVNENGFAAFSKAVETGNSKLSAVLENDVTLDMGNGSDCPMVGAGVMYGGTFDGQGHTINATVDAGGANGGIFANIKGATIRNVIAEGTVRNGTQTGFVGNADTENVLLENIIVRMDIEGVTNVAGMIGNGNNLSNKTITYRNCMFAGKVTYTGAVGKNGIGGFMGWSGSDVNYKLENCIMIGDIDLGTNPEKSAQFVRANNGCSFTLTNCAYIPAPDIMYINGHTSEANKKATVCENSTDGSLCYAANGNSFENPVWYQNLDEDEAPVLDDTHNVVYICAYGYTSKPKTAYEDIITDLQEMAEEYTNPEKNPAQKILVENYLQSLDALNECKSFEQMVSAYYPAIEEQYQLVTASMKAYADYSLKAEQTRQYIEDNADDFMGGPAFQKLESYLSDELTDPDEDEFPNGSFAYIIDPENLLLDADALKAEMEFIDKLLNDALNEGLNPGADATSFIVNADFSNSFNAWEGTLMTTAAQSESYPDKYIAESWSSKAFDMHQTVTLPENGIYELTLNGAYRINELVNSHQYSAMIYLNDNKNYLPTTFEDVLPADEAQDKVNCWLTGTSDYAILNSAGETIGYTPHGMQGAACAFFTGRYPSRILVNITDNTLTVGVRNSHILTTGNEWVTIGNLKLTYIGQLDEAGEALDATLGDMKARAEYLLAQDPEQELAEEVKYYPNFDSKLRAALLEKINAIDTAEEPAEKYALIEEIGNLFEQIVECKANYGRMLMMTDAFSMAVEAMETAGEVSKEDVDAAYDAIIKTMGGYTDGLYTSEEAAKGGDLANSVLYPSFNMEGTMQIATGMQLNIFAALVNNGNTKLNAELTDDVSVGSGFVMIGTNNARYTGTFDGKGHTITADIDKVETDIVGIFGVVTDATICNMKVTGNIVGNSNVGFVGRSYGKTLISNVESNLYVLGYNNVGGFIGNAGSGPQEFQNCLFTGKAAVDMSIGGNGAGGFVGWSSDNTMKASNCLCIGEVEGAQLAYFFRVKCDGTIGTAGTAGCYITANNLYLLKRGCKDQQSEVYGQEALVSGTPLWWGEFLTDVIEVVEESQVQNGEVCFMLNEGQTVDPVWRQDLGKDQHPMLLSSHSIVIQNPDGSYANIMDEDGISFTPSLPRGEGTVYDMSGRRLDNSQLKKGIYIVNGRKIAIK